VLSSKQESDNFTWSKKERPGKSEKFLNVDLVAINRNMLKLWTPSQRYLRDGEAKRGQREWVKRRVKNRLFFDRSASAEMPLKKGQKVLA